MHDFRVDRLIWHSFAVANLLPYSGVSLSQDLEGEHSVLTELPAVEVVARHPDYDPAIRSASVTVLDREVLEISDERDLNGVLRGLPGVTLRKTGSGTTLSTLFVRGMTSGQGLVIVDGIPMYSAVTTGFNLSTIPVDALDRIEVVRGPLVTRYGSHALGGALLLFTRDSLQTQAGLHVEGGSFGTLSETLTASAVGTLGRATLAASRDDVFDGNSQADAELGNSERDRYQSTQGLLKTVLFPDTRFGMDSTLFYTQSRAEFDGLGPFGLVDDDIGLFREKTWMAQSTARFDVTADYTSRLQLGFTQTHPKGLFVTPSEAPPPFSFTNELLLARWTNHHDLFSDAETSPEEQNTNRYVGLVWGVDVRNEDGEHFFDGSTPIDDRGTIAGFAEVQAEFGTFSAVLGTRTDHYDDFGTHSTFYLGSSVEATSDLSVRASIGNAYRVPSFQELFFAPFINNSALQPERAIGGDFGLEWEPISNLQVSLGGFYQRINNLILLTLGGDPLFKVENVDDSEISGVELDIVGGWNQNLTTGLAYTYTDARDLTLDSVLPGRPQHQVRIFGNWTLPTIPVSFFAEAYYRSQHFTDSANIIEVNDALVVNAQVSYELSPRFQLYVRAENLTDNRTPEVPSFGVPGVGVFGGFRISF